MDIYKLKYLNYKTSFYKCLNEVKMDCISELNLQNYKRLNYKLNFINSKIIKFIKLLKEWFLRNIVKN